MLCNYYGVLFSNIFRLSSKKELTAISESTDFDQFENKCVKVLKNCSKKADHHELNKCIFDNLRVGLTFCITTFNLNLRAKTQKDDISYLK